MRLLKCFNYWCGSEAYWNWFDMLLAATGFADILLQIISGQEAEIGGTGLLRFCRAVAHNRPLFTTFDNFSSLLHLFRASFSLKRGHFKPISFSLLKLRGLIRLVRIVKVFRIKMLKAISL